MGRMTRMWSCSTPSLFSNLYSCRLCSQNKTCTLGYNYHTSKSTCLGKIFMDKRIDSIRCTRTIRQCSCGSWNLSLRCRFCMFYGTVSSLCPSWHNIASDNHRDNTHLFDSTKSTYWGGSWCRTIQKDYYNHHRLNCNHHNYDSTYSCTCTGHRRLSTCCLPVSSIHTCMLNNIFYYQQRSHSMLHSSM